MAGRLSLAVTAWWSQRETNRRPVGAFAQTLMAFARCARPTPVRGTPYGLTFHQSGHRTLCGVRVARTMVLALRRRAADLRAWKEPPAPAMAQALSWRSAGSDQASRWRKLAAPGRLSQH